MTRPSLPYNKVTNTNPHNKKQISNSKKISLTSSSQQKQYSYNSQYTTKTEIFKKITKTNYEARTREIDRLEKIT
jgi:hypothetical protein